MNSIDILQDSNPIENIDFSEFFSPFFLFSSWTFMLFGLRISSVVAFYLVIIFCIVCVFLFRSILLVHLGSWIPIACLQYLTHFIRNWISNCCSRKFFIFIFVCLLHYESSQSALAKWTHTYTLSLRIVQFYYGNNAWMESVEKRIAAKAKIYIFIAWRVKVHTANCH